MLSDPIRIADAINNPKFHAVDEVVLAEGPIGMSMKYSLG